MDAGVGEERVVKTSDGKEIACDLVIPCTGTKLNNDFYKEELGSYILMYNKDKILSLA